MLNSDNNMYWDGLRSIIDKASIIEGSLKAVEKATGLNKRALKNFMARQRRDRPNGATTTLSEAVERKLRSYLQKTLHWPHPEPTLDELLDLAREIAAPPLPQRERFAQILANLGYCEEVSPDRITAYEGHELLRIYEPTGGLVPADYFAFGPAVWDDLDRAAICEAVTANLIVLRGCNLPFARQAASSLHLSDRDGFAADDEPPDFDSLVAEAISNQRGGASMSTEGKPKMSGNQGRQTGNIRPLPPERKSLETRSLVQVVPPEYLSPVEAAAFLCITHEALEHLRKSRKIRSIQVGDQRGFIYAISDLRDFAARRTIPTGEEERQRRRR